jgi:hypothetical protein
MHVSAAIASALTRPVERATFATAPMASKVILTFKIRSLDAKVIN